MYQALIEFVADSHAPGSPLFCTNQIGHGASWKLFEPNVRNVISKVRYEINFPLVARHVKVTYGMTLYGLVRV